MGKYVFLETNIFLHYKPVNQLELERFGEGCTLVVPRVILGELNKHKDSHSLKTIRNRARAACKSIHAWSDSKSVSDTLAFEFNIKTSSPEEHGLDPQSKDDRFLSDILEHSADLADKILLSNDSNLYLTAKHLDISVEEIDERFRLPAEPDTVEKENRRLKREIDQLRNARPRLEIGLVGDESRLDVNANPVFPLHKGGSELTDEEIERQVEAKCRSLRGKYISLSSQQGSTTVLGMGVSARDIEFHNQELDAYPDKYRLYLQERREFLTHPFFRFTIAIANVGTAPAKNVDISLHFSDGFELFEEGNLPSAPREPNLPKKPLSAVVEAQQAAAGYRLPNFTVPQIDVGSSFSLKHTNSYEVSDSFRVIKHNERATVQELFLMFASLDAAKPFRCDYRITVDNLPNVIEGNINFQFSPE